MLTANRFDEIKTFTAALHGKKVADIAVDDITKMAVMLAELAAEIERLRTPAQVPGRGHLKSIVLDAQGKPVAPPPIAQQLAVERREQYDADRFEALMAINDQSLWKKFSLRWGLAPPPGGWDNTLAINNVMHMVRLGVKDIPYFDKHLSAVTLRSRGHALPKGVYIDDQGTLIGVELPDA